ncbi:MAG: fibronectin type III domain-containing protein [Caldilineaceae bacterium]|nr:fibronectin type III domain-containing protein [Caldilineaceae bacterium]
MKLLFDGRLAGWRRRIGRLALLTALMLVLMIGRAPDDSRAMARALSEPAAPVQENPQLFFPTVYYDYNDFMIGARWRSILVVQNTNTASAASVRVKFIGPGGQQIEPPQLRAINNQNVPNPFNLPAGRSAALWIDSMMSISSNSKYAAVVLSDQPLAGVHWTSAQKQSPPGEGHGLYQAFTPTAATTAYAPTIANNVDGFTSNLAIQNLSSTPLSGVTLTTFTESGMQRGSLQSPTIAPYDTWRPDLSQAGIFPGERVALTVSATGPIGVVDDKFGGANGLTLLSYTGNAAVAQTLYAPGLSTNAGGSAALTIHNTSTNQPAMVTISHSDNIGNTQVQIPPRASRTVDYPANSHGNQPFVATINANQPVAAVATNRTQSGGAYSFEAVAAGAKNILFPIAAKNYPSPNSTGAFSSNIFLFNPGQTPAQVTVTYPNGFPRQDQIGPGQALNLVLDVEGNLPPSAGGFLVNASEPLLAMTSMGSFNGNGDLGMGYTGIEAQTAGVTISKQASGQYFKNGDIITYTLSISVGESGGSAVITDDLPDELTNTSYTVSDGLALTPRQGPDYTWDAEVPAGGGVITIVGTLESAEDRGVANVATITDDTSSANSSATVVLDVTPPNTTLDSQPPDPDNNASAEFTFSGDDSNAQGTGSGVVSFECQVDGGPFAPCTSPHTTAPLSDGQHTFAVRAIDRVGHVDPTPASHTWTLDTVAPAAPVLVSPANNSTLEDAQSATLTWQAPSDPDVAGYVVKFDGQETDVGNVTSYVVNGLSAGTYPWSIAAYDTAGNRSAFAPTFSFQIVGPGLAVSKRANVSSSPVGGVIQYTYHVTNTGNVALTLQVVDDKLGPVTLSLLPGGTVMLPATSLPAGREASGARSYTVKASDLPGPLVNTVVVTGASPSGQVVTASASATVALEGASGDATVTVQPGQPATMSYTDPSGGKVTVQIPAGAVDQPTTFVYDNQAAPSHPGRFQFAGRSFTLTAFRNNSALDGLTFLQPVTLVIEYTDADVARIDEETLLLFFYDEATGSWSQVGITVVSRDPANNRITLQITHLTEFALGALGPIYLPLVHQ